MMMISLKQKHQNFLGMLKHKVKIFSCHLLLKLSNLICDLKIFTLGLILGSFFYTYGLLQVVGARYAEQFGSKLISLVILFSSGLLSFLTPTLGMYFIKIKKSN